MFKETNAFTFKASIWLLFEKVASIVIDQPFACGLSRIPNQKEEATTEETFDATRSAFVMRGLDKTLDSITANFRNGDRLCSLRRRAILIRFTPCGFPLSPKVINPVTPEKLIYKLRPPHHRCHNCCDGANDRCY